MKKLLPALLFFAVASLCRGAVMINLTGNPWNGPDFVVYNIVTREYQPVPDGSLIRIGTFVSPPTAELSYEMLGLGFREFSRTTMGNTANPNTGRPVRNLIEGSNTTDSPDPDSFFVEKNIYIWVSADYGQFPDYAHGLYSTPMTFQDQAVGLSVSTTFFNAAYGTGPYFSNASLEFDPATGAATRFRLAGVIPEPSVMMLRAVLAAAGLGRRRR